MQINEALNVIEDGHTIWKVSLVKRVCTAFSIPFNDNLVKKFYSEPADIMGAHMSESQEGSLGVYSLDLSEYVAKTLGVKDRAMQKIGRGSQAREYARAVKEHLDLAKLTHKELRTHDIVMIYEDPITEQKPEGKAFLLHKIGDLADGLERWKVCFAGEDGGIYERAIKGNK